MTISIELSGKRFGRLLVIGRAQNAPRVKNTAWKCRCDCGVIKTVRGDLLRRGEVVSCGCFQKEVASRQMSTHGLSKTREFSIWATMLARCNNVNHKAYKNYGRKGIKVCDRWKDSFENFYSDMGQRPSPEHSIDRIDNYGPYSPENCRWTTASVQSRNTSHNHVIEINGVSFCVADWCDIMEVSRHRPYEMKYWNKRSGIKTVEEAVRHLYAKWKDRDHS